MLWWSFCWPRWERCRILNSSIVCAGMISMPVSSRPSGICVMRRTLWMSHWHVMVVPSLHTKWSSLPAVRTSEDFSRQILASILLWFCVMSKRRTWNLSCASCTMVKCILARSSCLTSWKPRRCCKFEGLLMSPPKTTKKFHLWVYFLYYNSKKRSVLFDDKHSVWSHLKGRFLIHIEVGFECFFSRISKKIELSSAVMCYFKCSVFESFPRNWLCWVTDHDILLNHITQQML